MEYTYIQVIIAVFIVLRTVHYYFLKNYFTNSPCSNFISDLDNAKEFLKSSNLISRTRSNQHLTHTFGISNPFTNSNTSYHKAFRKAISKTINFNNEEWQRIKNISFEAVNDYTNLDIERDDVLEIVPWIQQITLKVVLRGYLEMDVNDEVIKVVPGIINDLWLKSKELDQNKELTSILKRILKNLLSKAATSSTQQKKADGTLNVIQEISKIAKDNFPSAFDSSVDKPEEGILADDLESPLNILIPAYETMWRVVLYAILEIKIRPSLGNENVDDFEGLDNEVKVFLENPSQSKLKASPLLWSIVQETLRLYPPTRHIHRINDEKCKFIIGVETINRDPKVWGEDANLFKPKRFLNKTADETPHISFSVGNFKCVADKFAPTLAAIIISTILDRVDNIILDQQTKESLLQNRMVPFENSRRAFDNYEVTITKKKIKCTGV